MVINLSPSRLAPFSSFPKPWDWYWQPSSLLLGSLLKNSEPSSLLRACEPKEQAQAS